MSFTLEAMTDNDDTEKSSEKVIADVVMGRIFFLNVFYLNNPLSGYTKVTIRDLEYPNKLDKKYYQSCTPNFVPFSITVSQFPKI